MRHQIIFLGKIKNSFLQDGVKEYSKRLGHYAPLDIHTIKDPGTGKTGSVAQKLQGKALLGSVSAGAFIVALDSSGRQLSSREFAGCITGWENRGIRTVSWLIGGPEGHDSEVLQQADFQLSFSAMTFTHDFIRLLLLEQLYRAYTIKAGEKYHK